MMTEKLLHIAEESIPKKMVTVKKSTHPWLSSECEEAVRRKHAAEGTDRESDMAKECSAVFMEHHYAFINKMRAELANTKKSSKSWWSKARQLLDQKSKTSSIPAMKQGSTWILDAKGKADIFADTFAKKNVMIEIEENKYSEITILEETPAQAGLPSIETTQKVLMQLDEDSALGPDLLPTRILKRCAAVVAPLLHALILLILQYGEWPEIWMVHWMVPLYKKNSVYDARNYRGIHLTSQLSKAAERVLASLFVPQLIRISAFGYNQFAYMPERGARDALAHLVATWISLFGRKRKIGVYCSDVSGAFDKVNARRLLRKLQSKRVHEDILAVLKSWLSARKARVAVGGQYSKDMEICNMVYQGTVLGPPLWNIFYEDASLAIRCHEFCEIVFADDLNAFKAFEFNTSNEDIFVELRNCQSEVHAWGRANQVSFDANKESMHILALSGGEGPNFKLLGVPFDTALNMKDAVVEIVGAATWKMGAILRTARYFTDAELLQLYKSKLLSFLEYRTAAIYHACDTTLRPLDNFQERFLAELGIPAESAMFEFNLAPLACRRDMAMLGIVHRCVLGKGPAHFNEFFKLDTARAAMTRNGSRRHGRQLVDIRNRQFLEIERRSILGLIWVYNHLPATVVAANTVSLFQHNLQLLLKERLSNGYTDWRITLSPRIPVYRHPLR